MKINRIDIKGEVYDIEAYENPIPTGSVFPFAGITAPEDFLLCNGQEVSRFTYAKLYEVIGDTYGAGDGSTTFNLPDYRETVLIGAGQNEKLNIKEHDVYNIGEFKDDQLQTHKHYRYSERRNGWNITPQGGGSYGYSATDSTIYNNGEQVGEPVSCREGSTTHGKQVGVNFIIKV